MTDHLIIEVDDAKAQRWFGELLRRGADLSPLMAEIGENLLRSTQQRFSTGLAPDGTAWAPLRDGSGRTPLLDTGTMRDQIDAGLIRPFGLSLQRGMTHKRQDSGRGQQVFAEQIG